MYKMHQWILENIDQLYLRFKKTNLIIEEKSSKFNVIERFKSYQGTFGL